MANARQKQRTVWINDRYWEWLLQMKGSNSISKYVRRLIQQTWKEWDGSPMEVKIDRNTK
jgi:predicted CopG family antitoxin